ncbi:MAG: S41 family peptidase, partial [Bacteroidota bacterium]
NRGTIFNKPLLVLVNAMSASASELFAATIQDHNRGIIIGANTYGKASMQTILPIDAYKYNSQEMAMLGSEASAFVKLTVGKFYRVSGESLQQKGVTPDIPLPTIFDGLKLG